jgi:hypothetical protein
MTKNSEFSSLIKIKNSTVIKNLAYVGGGLIYDGIKPEISSDVKIEDNSA